MTWFLTAWKYRNLIGIAALVFLIGGLWLSNGSLRNDRDALAGKYKQAMSDLNSVTEVARRNAAEVIRIEEERKRTVAVLDEARASDAKRQETLKEIIQEVNNAPVSNCPAGDRLDAANRGLLKLSTERSGD